MIYKVKTTQSTNTIKAELKAHAKEVKFGVLHIYEFKKLLKEKGFPIERDITLFEVCNPQGAQEALMQIPEISVYLPCRISVYEENDETILATIDFHNILSTLDINEELKSNMSMLFDKLKHIMHSWDT